MFKSRRERFVYEVIATVIMAGVLVGGFLFILWIMSLLGLKGDA